MGRPREFDEQTVVRDAMEAFWQRGFHATSVSELLNETGLNRGSLYGSFGDKHALFMSALEQYDRQGWELLREKLLRPGPAREVIRDWLNEYADSCVGEQGRRGCLAGRAAMEVAPHDPEVAAWLRKVVRRNQRLLADLIERGQREGDFAAAMDAKTAARFLWATLAGLRMMGAVSPPAAEIREVLGLAMKVLEA
jgi:TetR/AcrR family transcriptional repressor of nem operon